MYLSSALLLSFLVTTSALPYQHESRSDAHFGDIASGEALRNIAEQAYRNAFNALPEDGKCSKKNVQIRKEFRYLPKEERKAFTDAVQCLQTKPSTLDPATYPGAKSLYDDFIVQHINQTFTVHSNANFLIWHRYYIWAYHKQLIDACGYTGHLPYWEWGLDVASGVPLRESPVFNGDPYSMGSDGTYVEDYPGLNIQLPGPTPDTPGTKLSLPHGTGGGCVFSGPFANYTVNLGPLGDPNQTPVSPIFAWNPRCLRRDLSLETAQNWTSFANYTPPLIKSQTPYEFQTLLDGDPRNPENHGTFGMHGGGHFIISGDPGDDFFVSPGDPMFFLHHGNVDRMYTIWQTMYADQIEYRTSTLVNLTRTLMNDPPSAYGELSDPIEVGPSFPVVTNADTLSTTKGPFCYLYQ